MKYMENMQFIFQHNGVEVCIKNKLTGEEIWLGRNTLQTALDFSEDME